MPKNSPKIVTLDIETAPLEAYTWGIWDVNVALNQIKTDWSILSVSWKWLGKRQVFFEYTGGHGADKVRDDKALVSALWHVLDEADIVVGQNVQKFDLKKINARMLKHGLKPYAPVKLVDTMLTAKRHFAFTSNKLEYMSEHFTDTKKSAHKKFPGFELWAECLKDNPAAWAEMAKYNKVDVVATEKLYLNLRPWIAGHPNVAAYSEMEAHQCPKCGSAKVQHRGRALTQSGEYARYQCQGCGGWSRSRYTLNTTSKRKGLLAQ